MKKISIIILILPWVLSTYAMSGEYVMNKYLEHIDSIISEAKKKDKKRYYDDYSQSYINTDRIRSLLRGDKEIPAVSVGDTLFFKINIIPGFPELKIIQRTHDTFIEKSGVGRKANREKVWQVLSKFDEYLFKFITQYEFKRRKEERILAEFPPEVTLTRVIIGKNEVEYSSIEVSDCYEKFRDEILDSLMKAYYHPGPVLYPDSMVLRENALDASASVTQRQAKEDATVEKNFIERVLDWLKKLMTKIRNIFS